MSISSGFPVPLSLIISKISSSWGCKLIVITPLPLDEIKEKLLEHEYVTNREIQRKNREIDLSLNRSMEECPDCPKILKEYYNSIVDDIK